MFKVGQKVVCIDNSPMKSGLHLPSGLVVGEIYTISEITNQGTGCQLEEVFGDFKLERFKPLQPVHEINTSAIAKEFFLTPERIDIQKPLPKGPVHEPQPA